MSTDDRCDETNDHGDRCTKRAGHKGTHCVLTPSGGWGPQDGPRAMDNSPGNPSPVAEVQGRGLLIAFEVVGRPATQGSKIEQIIRRKGGEPVIVGGRTLTTVREDNPRLADWRQEVAHAARQVYQGPLLFGAVSLTLMFCRPRPKGHYGTGKNIGKLKASAPEFPISKPDLGKLQRAVEDALTGVIWRDDSQIVTHRTRKRWGPFGVAVQIESLDGIVEEEF